MSATHETRGADPPTSTTLTGGRGVGGLDLETDLETGPGPETDPETGRRRRGLVDGRDLLGIRTGAARARGTVDRTRAGNTEDRDHATMTATATGAIAAIGRATTTMTPTTKTRVANKSSSAVGRCPRRPTPLP